MKPKLEENEDLHTAVDIYLFCKEKGYETEKPVFPKNLKITGNSYYVQS